MKILSTTTEFSLGLSMLSCDDIVNLVKEHSIDKVFVADTMCVSAMIPLSEKLGDKLIFGVRFNLVEELLDEKKLPVYQPKVFPRTEEGMRLIYKYLTLSFEKPQFYFVPRLSFNQFEEMLKEATAKDFLITTGDFNSLLKHEYYDIIIKRLRDLDALVIHEKVLIPNAVFAKINRNAVAGSFVCLETRPVLYKAGDEQAFPIHYSINKNVEFNFLNPFNTFEFETTIANRHTEIIAGSSFYQWKKQDAKLPSMAVDPIDTLKKEVLRGFKDRFNQEVYGFKPTVEKLRDEYIPRLKYELDTIERLGFASYFLMVWEVTNWCQRQGIFTGPGRGSAAGSLISYCLGITDVDPIHAGLMFERFINPSRLDLPDIDLDFMSSRRDEIIQHLVDRYGSENVAGIINYASLQSKSALRSTCRIVGLDEADYACSKLIPSEFGFTKPLKEAKDMVLEVKHFSEKFPAVWEVATKLEGKLRNFGTHAAGIIVSNRPLINDAVIEQRGGSRVINWDKKICEKQGLIKLDVLGLTCLDILHLTVENIKQRHKIDLDIRTIPLDDRITLDNFSKGKTGGVFQFEGGSVKRLLRDLASTVELTFDDLVAANALNRPGPIEAGLVAQYVKGKNGDAVEPWHPLIEHIVKPTFNIPAYQEQIMQISVDLAGYSLPEADNLRKIMGKKLPEEMKKERSKFVDGCISKGVSKEVADNVFTKIEGFAMYAFNKSHSYAYSMLGYICMYLKTYYPVEFYAASLTYVADDKVRSIINEAKKSGIDVLPPEINSSTDKFMPIDNYTIVAPLNKVKYLSGAASNDIINARKSGLFKDVDDFLERTTTRYVNSRVLKALGAIGAFDRLLGTDPSEIDPVGRSRAINEYLPSIPLGYVAITRPMEIDPAAKSKLVKYLEKIKEEDPNVTLPFIGKTPKIMVIFDNASNQEADNKQFTVSKSFSNVEVAAYKAGLRKEDIYWTGLVKRKKKKGEKIFSNETLDEAYKLLQEEIDIVKPPIILALGSNIGKFFNPTMKGAAIDSAGHVIYDRISDCNIIQGFAPGQIYFDPEKQETLDNLFELAADML